jgi:hypothetical protein
MSRGKKAALILILLLLSLPLFFYLRLYIAWNGGIRSTIRSLKPVPNFKVGTVANNRAAWKKEIESTFNILNENNFALLGEVSTHDICYRGRHNWKTQDEFSHQCACSITRAYGFNGDFYERIAELEYSLSNVGWDIPDTKMSDLDGGQPDYHDSKSFMPFNSYSKKGLLMAATVALTETEDFDRPRPYQNVVFGNSQSVTYEKRDFQDLGMILQGRTQSHKWVLVVSVQGIYYTDEIQKPRRR